MLKRRKHPRYQTPTEQPGHKQAPAAEALQPAPRRRQRIGLRPAQCLLASLGVAISTFGLAMTVSVSAVMYSSSQAEAGTESPAGASAISYQVTVLHDDQTAAASSPSAPRDAVEQPPLPEPADNVRLHALSAGPSPLPSPPAVAAPASSGPLPPAALPARLPATATKPPPTPLPGIVATVSVTPAPAQRAALPVPSPKRITNVDITFYDCAHQGFCGAMANGRKVYEGAAACSYDLPLGTKFYIEDDPTRRVYTCDDRGLLSSTWVDIFWYYPGDGWDWQESVGRYGTIYVVAWGTEKD
jgi:hypothetical protein